MRDAPQRFTVGQVATVCTTRITPNPTVPIDTGRRATTRLALNIPRAVQLATALEKAGLQFTNGKRRPKRTPRVASPQGITLPERDHT
jgi:signal recognition particle subunit SEC65